MKNIIVGILTILVIALMALTASRGPAFQGGELGKVIADIEIEPTPKIQITKIDEEKEAKQLKALQDKAGNIGSVMVSKDYKKRCAACHGRDGSGEQDGRKLMGPKLYGQSADKLYKDLIDFKAGRKENIIMKGLLINLDEKALRKYADEIGGFASQKQD